MYKRKQKLQLGHFHTVALFINQTHRHNLNRICGCLHFCQLEMWTMRSENSCPFIKCCSLGSNKNSPRPFHKKKNYGLREEFGGHFFNKEMELKYFTLLWFQLYYSWARNITAPLSNNLLDEEVPNCLQRSSKSLCRSTLVNKI